MKKRYYVLFVLLFLLSLGAIFTTLLFDLTGQRVQRRFLDISVITREADRSVWDSIRQGMDQAAKDLDVELRLVTLTVDNSVDEQRALLDREVQGGADAIILSPADSDAMAEEIQKAAVKLPVVAMESDVETDRLTACIAADNAAMGRALAKEILAGMPSGSDIVLLDSGGPSRGVAQRLAGAVETFEAAGETVRKMPLPNGLMAGAEAMAKLIAEGPDAIVAFEPTALETAARAAQLVQHPPTLYGIGSTGAIASSLDRGIITAIAAQNDFAEGYLAVSAAVRAVENKPPEHSEPIGFSIIHRDDMYDPDHQKLLFPFVR
ncbi:MAG: substrate-binding domain-containing protein [Oscillospiraceae bacterium]